MGEKSLSFEELAKLTSLSSPDVGAGMVASSLAPQLGSDMNMVSRGMTDMRRLSVLREEEIPFFLYAKIRSKRSPSWGVIYDELLNLKVSTASGRGRRDIIRMEAVSKGGMQTNLESEIEKPNWIVRNILDRDWKKKQMEAGGAP